MILQASLLISELTEEEQNELKAIGNRKERSAKILEKLQNEDDKLYGTFSTYNVCRMDARFAMPAYFFEALSQITVY
jgi:hypothetical protein